MAGYKEKTSVDNNIFIIIYSCITLCIQFTAFPSHTGYLHHWSLFKYINRQQVFT